MKRTLIASALGLAAILPGASALAAPVANCCDATAADFPKAGGNLGNWNYSSLTQINKANIAQLGAAWTAHVEGGAKAGQESSVVAANGVLYVETTQGNVYAMDGATGAIKWAWKGGYGSQQRRGAAVGGGMVFTNAKNRVVALDQNTGAVVWNKAVDTKYGNVGPVAVVYYDGMIYVGTANGTVGSGIAMNALTGDIVWSFQGAAPEGYPGHDTWGGGQLSGGTPWMHPAIDPQLNTVYWTFGNARGGSSQDGSTRPGDNLYANSIVALDAKTGIYKWHFQSVHHDVWDMDGVMAPVLVDTTIAGQPRKIVVYGSKSGMFYILDRTNGQPLNGVTERAVPTDPRQQSSPTQPMPRNGTYVTTCPTATGATAAPPNYIKGCIFSTHWDLPVYTYPGAGGGGNWAALSYDPLTKLVYNGYSNVGGAHDLTETSNGFRAIGENMHGGIVAIDPATYTVMWKKDLPYGQSNGQGILTTAGGILFTGQVDGVVLALDPLTGRELWRSQVDAGYNSSAMTYMAGGEQYIAMFPAGNTLPYSDAPLGDSVWAFKVGGKVPAAVAPTPPSQRRPVTSAMVEGSVVNNTVILNRTYSGGVVGSTESDGGTNGNGMAPQFMHVAPGTTVTFTNPATNTKLHCATQFFEGLFNTGPLTPGQSFAYTFNKPGEYYYNDCTSPKATGKIVVN